MNRGGMGNERGMGWNPGTARIGCFRSRDDERTGPSVAAPPGYDQSVRGATRFSSSNQFTITQMRPASSVPSGAYETYSVPSDATS